MMVDRFRKGDLWGLFCTDAFSLVGLEYGLKYIVLLTRARAWM